MSWQRKVSGCPVLESWKNWRDENEALDCFFRSNMDALVLCNWFLKRFNE